MNLFWGGTMKIKELYEFEEIQQVIEIGNIKDEKEMVEKFVISPNLRMDLLEFLEYLKGNKKEKNVSVNVIGNYGTGKSHLLTFISLILSNPEMVNYIQDDEVRQAFSTLNKEFLVVKYELPAKQQHLSDIFFYRVEKQLRENYGIEIGEIDYDNSQEDLKELMEKILEKIKEKYPTKGLIVIFDEFSDFIKEKNSADQNYDLQFARQLAETSINQDFILILSMQEYIFSDPIYQDKAELINKIEQRFLKFNITSENVEDIVAKRMVSKSENQKQELKNLFKPLEEKLDNLSLQEDRYVNLFPIHPYTIEIISKLPYFENRSILKFISNETKLIQDNEFPDFVTYDLIYDSMIESEHVVKTRPEVKPIIGVVNSLKDIIKRLPDKYQEKATRLVKALAIKNLVTPMNSKGDRIGGDAPSKFAEDLVLLPNNSIMDPVDEVTTILNMLMQKSEGQFISLDNETNTYYINLKANTDYNQVIRNKAANMNDIAHNNQVFVEEFLLSELGFEAHLDMVHGTPDKKYVLEDTVNWIQKQSYREGIFTINVGNKLKIPEGFDYLVNLNAVGSKSIDSPYLNYINIIPEYDDQFKESIKLLAAVQELIKTKTHLNVMNTKKRTIIDEEIRPNFKRAFQKSTIVYRGKDYSLDELGITIDIPADIFSQIKENLLGEELTADYMEYPVFKVKVSKINIENTMMNVIRDILPRKGLIENLDLRSKNILIPLGLYKENSLNISNSKYANIILDKVEDASKNIAIQEIVDMFSKKPYGFQKEITYLIIAILLRNGDIMISSSHGKTFYSEDFNTLFKKDLKFNDLKYIKKEEGPGSDTQLLFDVLGLNKALLQSKKTYDAALKDYISKITEIDNDIQIIHSNFENIKNSFNIELPINDIKEKISFIDSVDFSKLNISSISQFKKLDYSDDNLNKIKEGCKLISQIKSLFNDYNNFIYENISYMKNALNFIDGSDLFKKSDIEELAVIYEDSLEIIRNINKLLKEDERRPLKGKGELFISKYKDIYYEVHENTIGKKVNWDYLDELNELEEMRALDILKNINSLNNSKYQDIKLKIMNLQDVKCDNFSVSELNKSYHCHCNFPNNNVPLNINNEIENLYEKTFDLLEFWKKQVIAEINENKDNIKFMKDDEKQIIENVLESQVLPDDIGADFVIAVNHLLQDVEIREINIDELYALLTNDVDLLKVNDFKDKINEFISENINSSSSDNVRIRIIKGEKDGSR